jgi:hypothetical protein
LSSDQPQPKGNSSIAPLFLASFVSLYFELVIIRYLSSEIRMFAYLKNLSLIACFFGVGLGMLLGNPPEKLRRYFPLITAAIFLLISFASPLGLTHITLPTTDYMLFGDLPHLLQGQPTAIREFLTVLEYLIVIPSMLYLVLGFFLVLGSLISRYFSAQPPLRAYGINLAGSLAGILFFTLVSFLGFPPYLWVLVGFAALLPFFIRDWRAVAAFASIVLIMAAARGPALWSPYYRISVDEIPRPEGWSRPSAYFVDVNHDYHQKMLDLSPEFLSRFPDVEPNKSGFSTYELPYRIVPHPAQVLIVGSGTGNDVAAALRHGATHVDAVEIDPVILQLGRRLHPEQPYSSPRVTAHNDDARAFFKKTRQKYDLIVFAYLDSHTLLTSMSSIRLDNYVYTLQSFQEARSLLAPNGTVILAFSTGKSFLGDRMYATLAKAFDAPPKAYYTGYDGIGVVYVEGNSETLMPIHDFPDVAPDLQAHQNQIVLATDYWPFLYVKSRTIPVSIIIVLVLFFYVCYGLLKRTASLRGISSPGDLQMFFLGAGFLLLETKGVTELSLLFGSTWIVNAVVIAGFLLMGLLANTVVSIRPIPRSWAFALLFAVLLIGLFVPYNALNGLAGPAKSVAAALLVGLPVFFSGLVFSGAFRAVPNPARSLGVNLMGAVVGGALENLVMVGGTPILGVLAIALYAGAALTLIYPRKQSGTVAAAVPVAK